MIMVAQGCGLLVYSPLRKLENNKGVWRYKCWNQVHTTTSWGVLGLQWVHSAYVLNVDEDGRSPVLPMDGPIQAYARVVMTLRLGTLTEAAYKVHMSHIGKRETGKPAPVPNIKTPKRYLSFGEGGKTFGTFYTDPLELDVKPAKIYKIANNEVVILLRDLERLSRLREPRPTIWTRTL